MSSNISWLDIYATPYLKKIISMQFPEIKDTDYIITWHNISTEKRLKDLEILIKKSIEMIEHEQN